MSDGFEVAQQVDRQRLERLPVVERGRMALDVDSGVATLLETRLAAPPILPDGGLAQVDNDLSLKL